MAAVLRIVAVDDEADDVELIRLALEKMTPAVELVHVQGPTELQDILASNTPPPLVLCDYNMPGFSAEHAMRIVAAAGDPPALVVVTRAIGEEAILGLFRCGAMDYVPKDKLGLLPAVITRVLEKRAVEAERRESARALYEANLRLRTLSARLIDAQERERTEIARDLHDSLGQVLTGIAIHVEAAMGRSDAEVRAAMAQVQTMTRHAIDDVKSLSFALRPAQLSLLGLAAAIQAAMDRQLSPMGVRATLRRRGQAHRQALPSHAVAVRVVQEALTNVARHAQASQVLARVHFLSGDRLCLAIADDGVGFDVRAALSGGLSERNLGLRGMIERVELFGGRLRFRSARGRGTVLRLCI